MTDSLDFVDHLPDEIISSERPTGRIRIRRGKPGTAIPPSFGLEQEIEVTVSRYNHAVVRLSMDEIRREWRPVQVVEFDAE